MSITAPTKADSHHTGAPEESARESKAHAIAVALDNPHGHLCARCLKEIVSPEAIPTVALTTQEQGVLRLYASGMTMYSVARELGIQPSSVATYIKRIRKKYAKIGVHLSSKVDLNRAAREAGLIT
jgi:DNA-binding NarL/FixJ family response regulator